MRNLLFTLTLLAAGDATACPTIATGTPSELSFGTAQVAIVHINGRTTFSVSINPQGPSQPFALVLPVPAVLGADDIRTLDSEVFHQLDGYTAPRRVQDAGCRYDAYVPCPESDVDTDADGDGDSDSDADGDAGVEVEASYLVGSYAISILSSDESSALKTWLDANGYYLPEGAEERLVEYIDAGSYFLVAKVSEAATIADGSPLMPLQVSYDSDVISIPIRLAALSAVDTQDMIIYALMDGSEGRLGLANYPEVTIPDQCVWGSYAGNDFTADQAAIFDHAWEAAGDAAWALEFSDAAGDCNPCTNFNPFNGTYDGDILAELGFVGPFTDTQAGWPWISRLHMRYSRETADADLVLYTSGIHKSDVLTYADDTPSNRSCIDTWCDGTATVKPETIYEECPEDTGTTDDETDGVINAADGNDDDDTDTASGCGCAHGGGAHGGGAGLGASVAGLALLSYRRRSRRG